MGGKYSARLRAFFRSYSLFYPQNLWATLIAGSDLRQGYDVFLKLILSLECQATKTDKFGVMHMHKRY